MCSCEQVTAGEEKRKSFVQLILHTSTDVGESLCQKGERGVTLSYVCPHCLRFPLEDYIWRVSSGHGARGGQHD